MDEFLCDVTNFGAWTTPGRPAVSDVSLKQFFSAMPPRVSSPTVSTTSAPEMIPTSYDTSVWELRLLATMATKQLSRVWIRSWMVMD
nr:hypothetical protein CFP56_60640 [Quercus suber]